MTDKIYLNPRKLLQTIMLIVILFGNLRYGTGQSQASTNKEICLSGTINNKIPVFIHYAVRDKVVIGEIVYLRTKGRKPIPLAGSIEADGNYELLEFGGGSTITGVLRFAAPNGDTKGTWSAPNADKSQALMLMRKDTVVASVMSAPAANAVFGSYSYRWGKEGAVGDFVIKRLAGGKAQFNIYNISEQSTIAEVEPDTVSIKENSFTYKILDSENCRFRVQFYKDYVYVNTLTNECGFGMNAFIDGIYRKTSK